MDGWMDDSIYSRFDDEVSFFSRRRRRRIGGGTSWRTLSHVLFIYF